MGDSSYEDPSTGRGSRQALLRLQAGSHYGSHCWGPSRGPANIPNENSTCNSGQFFFYIYVPSGLPKWLPPATSGRGQAACTGRFPAFFATIPRCCRRRTCCASLNVCGTSAVCTSATVAFTTTCTEIRRSSYPMSRHSSTPPYFVANSRP